MKQILSLSVKFLALMLACMAVHRIALADIPSSELDAAKQMPLKAIQSLDVPRYMGTWFEIARFPNRFQKKCVGFSKADYQPNPDGTVKVTNQCLEESGKTAMVVGQARQIGDASSPKLEVRFAPTWLSFLPMVWGNYWIIDLDPAYSLAAVSEPERQNLWILSRSAKPDASSYEALLQRLRQQGLDTNRLVLTPQQ